MAGRAKGARISARNRRILHNNPVCHICGHDIDLTIQYWIKDTTPWRVHPDAGVVDHVIPLDKGGTEDPSNCAPAHARCNRDKSNKPFGTVVKHSGALKR